jgi:RIO-like serine/threonine protein kinase
VIEKNRTVRKSTSDKNYESRLHKQAAKQKEFFCFFSQSNFNIHVPKVESVKKNYFEMQYINGNTAPEFIANSGMNSVIPLITTLLDFIKFNVKSSKEKDCKPEILKKLNTVYKTTKEQSVKNTISKVLQTNKIILPMGRCHGDLTLSNIIVTNQKTLYFIDFLDSFIDSPMMDVIKLRQDTKHLWQFYSNYGTANLDKVRYCTMMARIDSIICSDAVVHPLLKNYNILQAVNFSRILPYVSNNLTKNYVINEIECLNGFNSSSSRQIN